MSRMSSSDDNDKKNAMALYPKITFIRLLAPSTYFHIIIHCDVSNRIFFLHRRSSYSCLLNISSAQHPVKAYGGNIRTPPRSVLNILGCDFISPSVDMFVSFFLCRSFCSIFIFLSCAYHQIIMKTTMFVHSVHFATLSWLKENETTTSQWEWLVLVLLEREMFRHTQRQSHTRFMYEHNAKQ